jgi:hypothetical protein
MPNGQNVFYFTAAICTSTVTLVILGVAQEV